MTAQPHQRNFTAALAVRERVPLLIGLMGPSGGGKTFSALRLASGVQQVSGGDIYFVDTEGRRALHYASQFKFQHVQFDAPFGSDDYLAALRYCVGKGAGVVIVDSMSHEHEGPGGLIDLQDQEMQRLAGDDYGTYRAERFNMLAWQKPKAARRRLINGLLQLNANFIFCFRAKETSKPRKVQQDNGRTKTEIVPMGFMPIAGDEFVYEMTLNALLLPGARGVPTWQSENMGERMMMKLPAQFTKLADEPRPFDEKIGVTLAQWARGESGARSGQRRREETRSLEERPSDDEPDVPPADVEGPAPAPEQRPIDLAGPDVDLEDWAASFNRGLASLETEAEVETAWKTAKANGYVLKLKAKAPGMATALAEAVNERAAELRAGAVA